MNESKHMARSLSQVDPEIYDAIQHEAARQDVDRVLQRVRQLCVTADRG